MEKYREFLVSKLKEVFEEEKINEDIIKAYEVGIINGFNKSL